MGMRSSIDSKWSQNSIKSGRRTCDAKVASQEGNSPEYKLRFLKYTIEVNDASTMKSSASDQQYFKKKRYSLIIVMLLR